MMAEDLCDSNVLASQVGGLDAGIAGLNEMSAFESMAERRISEAAADGAFDNLDGKGRPIDLDARIAVDNADALGAKILRNANIRPEWLETENAVRTSIEKFRAKL